jgi:hypothetical protein
MVVPERRAGYGQDSAGNHRRNHSRAGRRAGIPGSIWPGAGGCRRSAVSTRATDHHIPLNARIDRELIKTPPIQPDEANLWPARRSIATSARSCHGLRGKPSQFGAHMYPRRAAALGAAPQRPQTVVGVSDDPPGETYWKVANGIRLTGMPSFKDILTDTQMWQVSLLLANADKPLPPAAIASDCKAVAPARRRPGTARTCQRQVSRPRSRIVVQQRTGRRPWDIGKGRTMSVLDSLRKGFGFLLMSFGVSSPAKSPSPRQSRTCSPKGVAGLSAAFAMAVGTDCKPVRGACRLSRQFL